MILLGARERVADFILASIRDIGEKPDVYEAIGAVDKDHNLIGGFLYTGLTKLPDDTYDLAIAAAGSGYWLTPANLKFFFGYPFNQLGCSRITALIAKANKTSRNISERLGFVLEGKQRNKLGQGRDLLLYAMLKSECKWVSPTDRQLD